VLREFSWRAPVWQADLDAFGEVRSVSVLRLLQETATRASTDAGFDAAYYERTGTMWLIRRTTLSLAAPARYGDLLDVRTWIADFRRVRSQREYEVRAAGRLVARASTDWVYVDRAQGRPRRIPDEWERAFMPDGPPPHARVPFPERQPPDHAATYERRVELHELDALQHVNNSNYVAYLEQAALDAVSATGWTLETQMQAGGRLRAVMHDLEYLDSALYGDRILLTTWTTAVADDGIERHTHVHRGDATHPLLHARSRYEWWSAGEPASLPTALRAALAPPDLRGSPASGIVARQ
jgi:YbgC/YbaW family acyl-CoA thioester hydrolase